jgi:hypothetical protein
MTDAKYIIDENGNRTDVLLPIQDYYELLEYIEDLKALEDRKDEDTIDHNDVKKMFNYHD